MIFFPNAKINIGLHVKGRRKDGYHELETIYYPLPLHDVLELLPAEKFNFTRTGLPIPGADRQNLCVRALELLQREFPDLPRCAIWLYKGIPVGAGLGGGSADGSFMLRLINQVFGLGLSAQRLSAMALELGSDCPFFLLNAPCLATGRGEILEPIPLDLSNFRLMLVNPRIHVDTKWAFSKVMTQGTGLRQLRGIAEGPLESWRGNLRNDLEEPVMREYPQLAGLKSELYAAGALYVSMTGSGSSLFALFSRKSRPSLDLSGNPEVIYFK
jgi:4-diphosphocytidyl-2-C-methyl-D-erythritol kinase